MNFSSAALAVIPLLIPVIVWVVLNRRDAAELSTRQPAAPAASAAPVTSSSSSSSSDSSYSSSPHDLPALVQTDRPPRFHVGEFSSGGAVSRSARRTFVKDVLIGEHECVLFAYLEELHGRSLAWGDVLDAGTGTHSLGWMLALDSKSVTAVTGDQAMLRDVQRSFRGKLRPQDELVIGNWKDDDFLEGRMFDVVVADYLLGALVTFFFFLLFWSTYKASASDAIHGRKMSKGHSSAVQDSFSLSFFVVLI